MKVVDSVELDETNVEFNYAADFVRHTDKLIYLTGKAGTGKTTFLKYLKETTLKNTVILAPTGVAAVNAGGQTIYSFFQIRPSVYMPNDKRLRTRADITDTDKSTVYDHFKYSKDKLEIIKGLELLIIDEVSMVRCDLLDVVDSLLRVFRKRENEPFGGVQVILIGDTFQLAPIAKPDEWAILSQFYKTEFFFGSKVIEKNKPVYIELKKIYRQNEQEFIDLLNKVRVNQIAQVDLDGLNAKYNPAFSPSENSNYITLATHTKGVDSTNLTKLAELQTELKVFEAVVTGIFPENAMPTDKFLQLKEGAQIMFVKNDKNKKYYNGKIAKIKKIEEDKIIIEFSDDVSDISVSKEVWSNSKYSWDEEAQRIQEEVIGSFTQFPIKLAWAITVHKSQGLTFERVVADLGSAFASGQVYVALSRCTTFNGLVLKTKVNRQAIITDPQVLLFAKNETPSTLIVQELNSGKANYYYKKARVAVKNLEISEAHNSTLKAIKFRNDIDTDIFKKYLVVFISRLASYKSKFEKNKAKLNAVEEATVGLHNKIDFLNEENKAKSNKLEEQNRSIKLVLDKNKELEITRNKLTYDYAELHRKNKELSEEVERIQRQYDRSKNRIQECELINREQQIEVVRLKNIKWYEKLFGKK